MTEITKAKELKVAGLFYYWPRGMCQACGRNTEPVVEARGPDDKTKASLCSDCCQGMMTIHEEHDL